MILGFGVNIDGSPLFPPMEEADVLKSLRESLEHNGPRLRRQSELNMGDSPFALKRSVL